MPTRSSDAHQQIAQRLRTIARDSPGLKHAAHLYEAILPVLRDADLQIEAIALTPAQVRGKMEKGQPLLDGLGLELDSKSVREIMRKLARAVENAGQNGMPSRLRLLWPWASADARSARRVRKALEREVLDISALLPQVAARDHAGIKEAAGSLGLDPDLVTVLAQNALKPALYSVRGQLAHLAQGIPWERGDCYVCGAVATLAELQENDQIKHLRCGSCGADWRFPRLTCIYCGNEDHQTQRCLFSEQERERMRVEVCDLCHGYIKVISAYSPTLPEMLAIEDLATLHLDYIAQANGCSRTQAIRKKKSSNSRMHGKAETAAVAHCAVHDPLPPVRKVVMPDF